MTSSEEISIALSVEEKSLALTVIADNFNTSLAFMTLYLSVVSGYLCVAYLAGSKLTKLQVSFVTLLYVVFPLHFTLSSFGAFEGAHLMHVEAFPDSLGPSPVMNRGLAIFQLFGIVGCLKFMWDVRKNINE